MNGLEQQQHLYQQLPQSTLKFYLYNRSYRFGQRHGLIFYLLKNGFQRVVVGEIAPLPGFSRETLEEVITSLKTLQTHDPHKPLFPSIAFGLEAAYDQLSNPIDPPSCAVNHWIYPSASASLPDLATEGVIKCKVGHLKPDRVLNYLKPLLGSNSQLRLDCNRQWSLEEALYVAKQLPLDQIDYFEEPLNSFADLSAFPYPIALDETLHLVEREHILKLKELKAIVLKPTLLGSRQSITRLIAPFRMRKVAFILSSSYESEIGLIAIARLMTRLNLKAVPMGLDTFALFRTPLIRPGLAKIGERLHVPKRWRVNLDKLDGPLFRISL